MAKRRGFIEEKGKIIIGLKWKKGRERERERALNGSSEFPEFSSRLSHYYWAKAASADRGERAENSPGQGQGGIATIELE